MTTWWMAADTEKEIGNKGMSAERSPSGPEGRMRHFDFYLARFAIVAMSTIALTSCTTSRFGAVYPPRPNASPSPPVADPTPSRIVMHVAVTSPALAAALEDAIPREGSGDFPLFGG